nr:nucleotide-binding, alpha-beta plait [Tanacetum cinerariifolium]
MSPQVQPAPLVQQVNLVEPMVSLGQATILPHAFIIGTLQDPAPAAWNMDTAATTTPPRSDPISSLSPTIRSNQRSDPQIHSSLPRRCRRQPPSSKKRRNITMAMILAFTTVDKTAHNSCKLCGWFNTVSIKKPYPFATVPKENPNYSIWVFNDADVHMLIISTILEASFRHVQSTTSRDLRSSLEKAYAPHSTSREYTLKIQLLRIEMHGDETLDAYLDCAQDYVNALVTIGEPVKDKDLVMLVFLVLHEEYNGLKTIIIAHQILTVFSELHALLSNHDYMHGKTRAPESITSSFAANYAASTQNTVYGTCNRCGIGHIPSHCLNREPFTIHNRSFANFSNTLAQSSNASANWHSDTRANSYVTPDLEAMDNSEAYYSDDALHLGNGKTARKQRTVLHSSTRTEYKALGDTIPEITWLQALPNKLGIRSSSTPILGCDNHCATYLSANPVFQADGTLSHYTARLMENGSIQMEGVDVDKTFSPVVKPGISVTRDFSGLFFSQRKYVVEIFERAHMVICNPCRTPIDMKSKLGVDGDPSTLSRSIVEAEYPGVANVVAEICWLRNLLRELHAPLSSAMLVYCDNIHRHLSFYTMNTAGTLSLHPNPMSSFYTQMATNGNLMEVVTTCERSWVQASPWGFSFRSEK